jgi:hypothetical protein
MCLGPVTLLRMAKNTCSEGLWPPGEGDEWKLYYIPGGWSQSRSQWARILHLENASCTSSSPAFARRRQPKKVCTGRREAQGSWLVPRPISSVPKDGNLKFGKNATYLTHFPETRKFQISITKLQTNTNDQNRKAWRTSAEPSVCSCF